MTDDISIPRAGAIPEDSLSLDLDIPCPGRTDGFHLKDIILWHHLLGLWESKAGPRLGEMDLMLIAGRLWLGTEEIVECLERLHEGGLVVPVRTAITHYKGVPADSRAFMPIVPSWYEVAGWQGDGSIEGEDDDDL
jgi:hypothetical protein